MKVKIHDIIKMKKYLEAVNSVPLDKLELYGYEIRINIKKEELDDWDFTGLSNIDFIMNKWNKRTNNKA